MAIIKIRGFVVDILCKIASEYTTYVTRDKRGVNYLLLNCQNKLYGTILASLIYYCKLTNILTSIGFEINPNDPCVSNKVINGTHMKICFHVDNCKLIHHEKKANDCIIKWLR